MVLLMARPWRDPKSGMFYLRTRVPTALVPKVRGTVAMLPVGDEHVPVKLGEIAKASLRTREPAEAKARHAAASAALDAHYRAVLAGPIRLNRRQIVAIAGNAYRTYPETLDSEPGSVAIWSNILRLHAEARATGRLAEWIGPSVDLELVKAGVIADAQSRAELIEEVDRAFLQRAETLKRFAEGDFRPDPDATRFPDVEAALAPLRPAPEGMNNGAPVLTTRSFADLYDAYERVPGKHGTRTAATRQAYRKTFVDDFGSFMRETRKVEDPLKVARPDVAAWRDHLLASGLSAKTIKDRKLACVHTVYSRQVSDGAMTDNPAAKGLLAAPKVAREREKGFTDAEAERILRASLEAEQGGMSAPLYRGIRWLPWLMAYTGARVAEVAQLRGSDFRQDAEGGLVMRITPEAGSTKTRQYRDVPVHADLVSRGLLAMVEDVGRGHLFINGTDDREQNAARARVTAGRLSEWVRNVVKLEDANVQPNHGWRHRFTTKSRRFGLDHEKREYILGHSLPGLGDTYGDMAGLRREMDKLPAERVVEGEATDGTVSD